MGLTKGMRNNPDGRPKGSKNVRTLQWEQLGEFLTDKGAKRAMKVLNDLDDEAYLDQYGKLLNYFKPRMQATQLDANIEAKVEPITGVVIVRDEVKE